MLREKVFKYIVFNEKQQEYRAFVVLIKTYAKAFCVTYTSKQLGTGQHWRR